MEGRRIGKSFEVLVIYQRYQSYVNHFDSVLSPSVKFDHYVS